MRVKARKRQLSKKVMLNQGVMSKTLIKADITLSYTTSDLTTSLIEFWPDSEVIEQGAVCVDAEKFAKVIQKITDESFIIETKGNFLDIGGIYKLQTIPAEDYPEILEPEMELFEFESKDFKDCFGLMASISGDRGDKRAHIIGVCFEGNNIVSTDGSMMVWQTCGEVLTETQKLVSKDTFRIVLPYLVNGNFKIGFTDSHMLFKAENTVIISRLLEGQYPDFRRPFDGLHDNSRFIFDRANLMQAIDAVSVINPAAVTIDFKSNTISSESAEEGTAEIKITPIEADAYDGEIISLNPKYLMTALKFVDSENVTIRVENGEKPVLIEENNTIVMPMRR